MHFTPSWICHWWTSLRLFIGHSIAIASQANTVRFIGCSLWIGNHVFFWKKPGKTLEISKSFVAKVLTSVRPARIICGPDRFVDGAAMHWWRITVRALNFFPSSSRFINSSTVRNYGQICTLYGSNAVSDLLPMAFPSLAYLNLLLGDSPDKKTSNFQLMVHIVFGRFEADIALALKPTAVCHS